MDNSPFSADESVDLREVSSEGSQTIPKPCSFIIQDVADSFGATASKGRLAAIYSNSFAGMRNSRTCR